MSFIPVAPECDFSIHNLPYGVFSTNSHVSRWAGAGWEAGLGPVREAGQVQTSRCAVLERGDDPTEGRMCPLSSPCRAKSQRDTWRSQVSSGTL